MKAVSPKLLWNSQGPEIFINISFKKTLCSSSLEEVACDITLFEMHNFPGVLIVKHSVTYNETATMC